MSEGGECPSPTTWWELAGVSQSTHIASPGRPHTMQIYLPTIYYPGNFRAQRKARRAGQMPDER